MSCSCGGGCGGGAGGASGGGWREIPAHNFPALGQAGPVGAAQPDRAPVPTRASESMPWHVWLIVALTVISFLRSSK
jgi:hypothetical protein